LLKVSDKNQLTKKHTGLSRRIYLAVFVTILIWSLNYIFAKAALQYIDPMAFNALRYPIAAAIVVAWWRLKAEPQSLSSRELLVILAIGLWGYGVYQIFFIVGLGFTTAGNSALIGATAPLWTAVIGMCMGKDHLTSLGWVGIVLALAGVSAVIMGGQAHISINPHQTLGDLLTLMATLVWASFTVFSKTPLARHSYARFVAIGVSAGAILLLIVGWPSLGKVQWMSLPWWVYLVILFSGALSNAAAYLMWANAVAKIGPARTAIFLNLTPVITLGLGELTLNEPLAPLQVMGASGVLLGVWLTARK
jgi:drug/metabolite transporter (DMT)-like permease